MVTRGGKKLGSAAGGCEVFKWLCRLFPAVLWQCPSKATRAAGWVRLQRHFYCFLNSGEFFSVEQGKQVLYPDGSCEQMDNDFA